MTVIASLQAARERIIARGKGLLLLTVSGKTYIVKKIAYVCVIVLFPKTWSG